MKHRLFHAILCAALLAGHPALAAIRAPFSFGTIFTGNQSHENFTLQAAIEESNADNFAFVVTSGIKSADEPCTDDLYEERKQVLDNAQHGVIISLAASDWAECRNEDDKPAAIGRLNRLRELLFVDGFSAGGTRIPVVRQSTTTKFRSYAENMRWQIGDVMFATINLPANNNGYVPAAGRNSEFEDRLVANRDWLHHLFVLALQKKASSIVLFCDGNPLSSPGGRRGSRDGFAEIRHHIGSLSSKFPGRILIVHSPGSVSYLPRITWHGKLGEATGSGLTRFVVNPASPELFSITSEPMQTTNRRRAIQAVSAAH